MAKDRDDLAGSFAAENTGGLLTGFLAEEDALDRRGLWRLGSWGAAAVVALIVAVTANQSSIAVHREQLAAAADLTRQSQQIQSIAKEGQNETRRLAAAIDTLNGDRDRLYSRVTVLEQGLDSVTGTIARQNVAVASPPAASAGPVAAEPAPVAQNPAPVVAPVASTQEKTVAKPAADATAPAQGPAPIASAAPKAANMPATTPLTSLMPSKSIMAPPDAAAAKLIEPEKPVSAGAAAPDAVPPLPEVTVSISSTEKSVEKDASDRPPKVAVQRTEFAVDVGSANSIGGLRALWRGLLKSHTELAALRPIIVIREGSTGLGMQLRLVAGPLGDAAAAAKICAALIESERSCETTVFDGQRLAMKADETPATAKRPPESPDATKPSTTRPSTHRRSYAKRAANDDPQAKPGSATMSTFFRH